MDHAIIEKHLRQAEEHVALGLQHIARQQKIVAEIEAAGRDGSLARTLLKTIEDLQRSHEADRDRLAKALGGVRQELNRRRVVRSVPETFVAGNRLAALSGLIWGGEPATWRRLWQRRRRRSAR
jgi:hypothetical protein